MKLMKQFLILFCSVISLAAIQACDFTNLQNAVDDFKVVVELEPVNTYGTIQILDAVTEELVTGQVKVTFLNEDGDPEEHLVIDSYSTSLSEVTVTNGFVNFGIRNEFVPTEEEPIIVTVLIEREGYEIKYETLTFYSEGSNLFEVDIIDVNNLPDGITTLEQPAGTSSATGALLNDVEIQSGTTQNSNMSSGISFSSGIILKGQNGEPITGQLTANYRYYDTSELGVPELIPQVQLANEENTLIFGMTEVFIADQSDNPVTDFEPAVQKDGSVAAPVLTFSINRNLVSHNLNMQDFVLRYQIAGNLGLFTYSYNQNSWVELPDENNSTFLRFKISLNELSSFPIVFWLESAQQNPINATISFNNPSRSRVGFNSFLANGYSYERLERNLVFMEPGSTHTVNLPRVYTETRRVFAGYSYYRCGSWFRRSWCSYPVFINRLFTTRINAFPRPSRVVLRNLITGEPTFYSHNFLTDGNVFNIDLPGDQNRLRDTAIEIELRCRNASQKVRVTSIPAAIVMYRKVGTTRWLRAGNIEWNYQNLALNGAKVVFPYVEPGVAYEFRLLYDTQSVQPTETTIFTQNNQVLQRVLTLSTSQSSSVCD